MTLLSHWLVIFSTFEDIILRVKSEKLIQVGPVLQQRHLEEENVFPGLTALFVFSLTPIAIS